MPQRAMDGGAGMVFSVSLLGYSSYGFTSLYPLIKMLRVSLLSC